jgi:glycosyltransferase involved in cell wall biosynthesis
MHLAYIIARGGGPEAYLKTLAPWLLACGHRISVLYTGTAPFQSGMPDGVNVCFVPRRNLHYYLGRLTGKYRLWARRLRTLETSWEAGRVLESLHLQMPVDVIEVTEGYSIGRMTRRWPVIVRAHGSDWAFRHFCRDGDGTWDKILVREQARQFQQAHMVSPLSEHYADFLSDACQLPRSAFVPLPYPIDHRRFSPDAQGLPADAPVSLLSIGRLEHRKGSDVAVRAMNHVWREFPQARLYFLGREAQYQQSDLLALVPESQRQQIIFPGFLPYHALPDYYRSASLYLALTQFETFGYTVLEALACGTPVIACPTGAVPELLEDGCTGRLVPFDDAERAGQAIVELLRDDANRAEMSRAARQKAEQYALDIVGPAHLEMYERARQKFSVH